MKNKILIYIICGLIIFLFVSVTIFDLTKSKKTNKDLEEVVVAEVTHSVFYAPQYVAMEKGYFEELGIDVELILTSGADKVTAALLSGDADIGLSGSEATIYVYNGGEKDYLKTFGQLTQKDGSFIVSKKDIKDFNLNDMKGSKVIGGRVAGMPEMTFEYALKEHDIDVKNDLFIDTSIAFSAASGTFIAGGYDFVTLFEPLATEIENKGYGYVVASVGELGGLVPYTSYSARNSYINSNKEVIANFDKAIQKGIDFVMNSSDLEVAEVILDQFPSTSLNDLEKAVKRYREIEAWPDNTKFSEDSFNHLQDIMISYGELDEKVSYDDLFYNIEK